MWGQNPVYVFYTDYKKSYPLAFYQYENVDDENYLETKYKFTRDILAELDQKVGVSAVIYLFGS